MSNVSLNLENDFLNDTNQENLQTQSEEFELISSDSTKPEWRLPLAIIFAIVMMIYLVIVIVFLSGRAVILFCIEFLNAILSVSQRRFLGDTLPVISGFCSDLCGSCSHCCSCDHCSCEEESSSCCLSFLQYNVLDPWRMCLRDVKYLCCHLRVCKYFQKKR